jgi:putative aminopeptidase FrvX
MAPPVIRILERIAHRPTTSFHEHAVAAEATRIARESGATVRTDGFGNLTVVPPGRRTGPAIWLVAHMDHPGLEVLGPRQARLLGGVFPEYLRRGVRLRFYHEGEAIPAKLVRFTKKTRRIRFDGGAKIHRLKRGDLGVWELEDFRVAGGRVHARQLDDLAGCAVSLAAVARACRDRKLNLHALLTRAEEMGFVGTLAAASTGGIPKGAIVISVEASRALPGVDIGGGPVIRTGDRARSFDPVAENLLLAARDKLPKKKPVQRFLMSGGTCEATPWGLFGYRTTGVAIPLGNYHNMGPRKRLAPEIVAVRDLATAVDLLELAARHAAFGLRRDERLKRRVMRYLRQHGGRLRSPPKRI